MYLFATAGALSERPIPELRVKYFMSPLYCLVASDLLAREEPTHASRVESTLYPLYCVDANAMLVRERPDTRGSRGKQLTSALLLCSRQKNAMLVRGRLY